MHRGGSALGGRTRRDGRLNRQGTLGSRLRFTERPGARARRNAGSLRARRTAPGDHEPGARASCRRGSDSSGDTPAKCRRSTNSGSWEEENAGACAGISSRSGEIVVSSGDSPDGSSDGCSASQRPRATRAMPDTAARQNISKDNIRVGSIGCFGYIHRLGRCCERRSDGRPEAGACFPACCHPRKWALDILLLSVMQSYVLQILRLTGLHQARHARRSAGFQACCLAGFQSADRG